MPNMHSKLTLSNTAWQVCIITWKSPFHYQTHLHSWFSYNSTPLATLHPPSPTPQPQLVQLTPHTLATLHPPSLLNSFILATTHSPPSHTHTHFNASTLLHTSKHTLQYIISDNFSHLTPHTSTHLHSFTPHTSHSFTPPSTHFSADNFSHLTHTHINTSTLIHTSTHTQTFFEKYRSTSWESKCHCNIWTRLVHFSVLPDKDWSKLTSNKLQSHFLWSPLHVNLSLDNNISENSCPRKCTIILNNNLYTQSSPQ